MIEITAIRFEGGSAHEDITDVLWRSAATALGHCPREAIIGWLDESNENRAAVADGSGWVDVAVVRRPSQSPYIRARRDGVWRDDLLALPRF
jgi:Protein of unknown function (DUF3892)